MAPATRRAVAAILDADPGLSSAHRLAILTACDKAPATSATPSPGAEMPVQDAARILGKSLPTVLRWIDAGKLDGRQFGNRLWLVSSASVEAMREALAARVAAPRPVAPIPDLLAHLKPYLKSPPSAQRPPKPRRG